MFHKPGADSGVSAVFDVLVLQIPVSSACPATSDSPDGVILQRELGIHHVVHMRKARLHHLT